jgi:hypothetical protein
MGQGQNLMIRTTTTLKQRRVLHRAIASVASVVRPRLGPVAETLEQRMLLAAHPYQWPLGPETRVNTYTPDSQLAPAIAMDADGNYVVAWTSPHLSRFFDDMPMARRPYFL